jgi:hypothetical protein
LGAPKAQALPPLDHGSLRALNRAVEAATLDAVFSPSAKH